MSNLDVQHKARLLVNSTRTELELGTKHYDAKGNLLATQLEILETLQREGSIVIKPIPERQHLFRRSSNV